MNKKLKFLERAGLICDYGYCASICFRNYYYAIHNIFDSVKIINSEKDLLDVDFVFIGNDHFLSHRSIWENDNFINYCNKTNKKIFIYTAETIHNNVHPWNLNIQKNLEKFNNLYQWCYDVNDAIILKKPIARCCLSKNYNKEYKTEKKNKCIFIGTLYPERKKLIEILSKNIELDIVQRSMSTCEEYFDLLSQYRFVLSPHSIGGNSFPLRFYETLLVGSIPIHQVYSNTLNYYTEEAKFKDVIYFEQPEEIPEKISNFKLKNSETKIWLEDILTKNFIEHGFKYIKS